MTRTALLQAGAHALDLDAESGVPQALLELAIVPRRPDRENPAGPERRASRGESRVVVEAGVSRCGERVRAVVHVEQNGVERVDARPEHDRDVPRVDTHPPILQRVT